MRTRSKYQLAALVPFGIVLGAPELAHQPGLVVAVWFALSLAIVLLGQAYGELEERPKGRPEV